MLVGAARRAARQASSSSHAVMSHPIKRRKEKRVDRELVPADGVPARKKPTDNDCLGVGSGAEFTTEQLAIAVDEYCCGCGCECTCDGKQVGSGLYFFPFRLSRSAGGSFPGCAFSGGGAD